MIKKKTVLSLVSLALPACWLGAALPQEISVSSDLTYASKYIFRGLQFANSSFQPTVEAGVGDFYAGLWANLPTGQEESELNYYGGLSFVVPGVDFASFDAGLTVYHFPDTKSDRSHELFLGAAFDFAQFPEWSPSVYYFYDMDLETHVVEGALTYTYSLEGMGLSASLGASVFGGVQGASSKPVAESYNYYGVSIELPYALTEHSALTGGLHYANAEKIAGTNHKFFWTLGYATSF